MKFKSGDEVFIKAEITDVSGYECSERPYFVAPDIYSVNWVSEDKIFPMDKTYADGLKDAWELAKKILFKEYGYSAQQIYNIFGDGAMQSVKKLSYAEALAKIEAYEKEKEIKVGDVVRRNENGFNGIVTTIKYGEAFVMYNDGSSTSWSVKGLIKTGKHIDIESLLKQIGE